MTITTTELRPLPERVAAGAAWLDENEPDWLAKIDLDRLNTADGNDCPLGQLYGSYYDAPPFVGTIRDHLQWGIPRGFIMDDKEYYLEGVGYRQLDNAWRELITARRSGQPQAEETICTCGHPRRSHSRVGCGECSCLVTYMDLSPRR